MERWVCGYVSENGSPFAPKVNDLSLFLLQSSLDISVPFFFILVLIA